MTTPNINSLISMPFKKRPVKSREQFLGIWTEKKAYVARVGGKGASYQENKALRRSEEWPWPDASPGNSHQESKLRVCQGCQTYLKSYKILKPSQPYLILKVNEKYT